MQQYARAFVFSFLAVIAIASALMTAASAQTEKVIYSFANSTDGGYPEGTLTPDGKGNFYGTTSGGGANFAGTVFELSPASDGT